MKDEKRHSSSPKETSMCSKAELGEPQPTAVKASTHSNTTEKLLRPGHQYSDLVYTKSNQNEQSVYFLHNFRQSRFLLTLYASYIKKIQFPSI